MPTILKLTAVPATRSIAPDNPLIRRTPVFVKEIEEPLTPNESPFSVIILISESKLFNVLTDRAENPGKFPVAP